MESEIPAMGLGWSRSLHHNNAGSQQRDNGPQQSSLGSTPSPAAALMESYLHQCLEYHEMQERQRESLQAVRDDAEGGATLSIPFEVAVAHETQFVQSVESSLPGSINDKLVEDDRKPQLSLPQLPSSSLDDKAFAQRVEEGRARAQAILDRFLQQQTLLLGTNLTGLDYSSSFHDSEGHLPSSPLLFMHENNDRTIQAFVEQRQRGLEREVKVKQRALLRNFDYIARREMQRAQSLALELERTKELELQRQEQYHAALEERKRLQQESQLLHSQAAIGSHKRKKVEQIKRKVLHPTASSKNVDSGASVAIYVSGLPTDDSTIDERALRQLFGSYGVIRKVHLYRNKPTGTLKGDGLIVFQVNQDVDPHELLSMVCSQMHGAELPCGSIMSVEPADSNYTTKSTTTLASTYGPSDQNGNPDDTTCRESTSVSEQPQVGGDGVDEEDDNLDDFFNSLE